MSGRRIDDHTAWMGKGSGGSVLPLGSKMKQMSSAEGAGSLDSYEDTSEKIKAQQELNIRKAKSEGRKDLYRN
jgi:hypothetical protein